MVVSLVESATLTLMRVRVFPSMARNRLLLGSSFDLFSG
jgi:hypothetical protein